MALPNTAMDAVPFTPLTAAFLDKMIANIEYLSSGYDSLVAGTGFSTSAFTLGYAQITTNFTTSVQSATQVTGLTTTVTIPSGGRRIKITAFASDIFTNATNSIAFLSIWSGTVGSGTQLSRTLNNPANTSGGMSTPAVAIAVTTPTAGSKTYNVGFHVNGNTGTLEAGTAWPAFILVEAI